MKKYFWLISCLLFSARLHAQDDLGNLFKEMPARQQHPPVIATFKSGGLINAQSNETMHRHDLLFIVAHRFGDIAGSNGGIKNFFGLDNSTDILIAFDYGISDRLSVGTGRAKGASNGTNTSQNKLWYLNIKYRLLRQTEDDHIPFAVTLFGSAVASTVEKSDIATSDADFQRFGDRMSFTGQLIIARKFSSDLSIVLLPTYVRRNYVSFMDMNNLVAIGIGGRLRISSHLAIIADYFLPFRSKKSTDYYRDQYNFNFYNPLGIGLEIETGGHIFHINFTNATAILENQFIPSTSASWAKGQFRWGFNITRTFTLSSK